MQKNGKLVQTSTFFAAAYFVAATFAQSLTPASGGIVPVWPAAGVAFSAFLLLGWRAAPIILAADLLGTLLVGGPLTIALAVACTNTLSLYLGAAVSAHLLQDNSPFSSAKRMGIFLLTGPTVAAMVAAPFGAAIVATSGPFTLPSWQGMWAWFLSDYTGIVVIAPLVEAWRRHPFGPPPVLRRPEGWLMLGATALVTWAVFGVEHAHPFYLYPLPFAYIPVMAWATFRSDSRTLTLLFVLIFPVSCLCTAIGLGPFGGHAEPLPFLLLQVFSAVTSVTTMIIHTLNKERSASLASLLLSEAALRQSRDELERRVRERTSKLHETLEELRSAEETYRTLFENAAEGIYRADVDGKFVRVNPGFARMLGYASAVELKDKVVDISRQIFANPDDRARLYEQLSRHGQATNFEVPLRRRDGATIWASLSVRPVIGKDGVILGTEGIVQDITQRKLSEEELERRATMDPLTGAANRHHFERTFGTWAAQARRSGAGLGLLFLDLDDFKQVNDSLGHHAGDALLTQVAERIRGRMRASDMLARVGGDEFILLLHNLGSRDEAAKIAEAIIATLADPFVIDGQQASIGVSIGGSLFPDDGETLEALMRNADRAMYKAKQRGKNRFLVE